MTKKVNSAFDIAFYFIEKSEVDNQYLQPQKLQSLLFLSQAYFALVARGQKLMPAVFVADERGPLEPNVYLAFSKGRPDIDLTSGLPREIEVFLDSIWRRYGHLSTNNLIDITKQNSAYKAAKDRGPRGEIFLKEMGLSVSSSDKKSNLEKDTKSKIYRTQYGKTVNVRKWEPNAKLGRNTLKN